jgi:hypothetical protein
MIRQTLFMLLLGAQLIVPGARAQSAGALPFAPGERFEYAGKVHSNVSGKGTLWIDGPTDLRGTVTWVLHSDMEGSVGFLHATDKAVSWLDPAGMTSLRYTAQERHIISRHDEAVDIFASEKRWSAQDGQTGILPTDAPLDELSFLYYLRTLPFTNDAPLTVVRHYDVARNPTVLTVVAREDVDVGAGRFHAIVVEMRVRDPQHYHGEGVIRIALSDDRCRLLLRIESDVPDAGKASLALASYSGMHEECTALLK